MDTHPTTHVSDEELRLLRNQVGESYIAVSRGFSNRGEISAEGWCCLSAHPLINANRFLIQDDSPSTLLRFEQHLEQFGCASTAMFAGQGKRLALSSKWTPQPSTPFMMYNLSHLSDQHSSELLDSRVYEAKNADYERVVQCLIDCFKMDAKAVECSPFAYCARHIESMDDIKIFVIDNQNVVASIVYAVKVGKNLSLLAMGTVPSSRRQGLASAVLYASLLDGKRQGLEKAILFASAVGKLLYSAVGFQTLEEWTFYSHIP